MTLFYYVQRQNGTPATADDFEAFAYTVTNLTTGRVNETQNVGNIDMTGVISNDPRYRPTNNAPGYNLAINVPGDEFTEGECEYEVEVKFYPQDGESYTRSSTFWCEESPAYEALHGSSSSD